MITSGKKDEYIKIRVTKEQKELFKSLSKELGITMTDLLIIGTEEYAKVKLERIRSSNQIEIRAAKMENQIQVLKDRLEERKKTNKSYKNIVGTLKEKLNNTLKYEQNINKSVGTTSKNEENIL
ncbi:hypothetical protein [Clostridium perfringens]|uniref:hypothetical protein n=1 Tax=Clostridium perfringens TaxID=1502 RepID=UPI00220F5C78|nr:hypothetical protein [Clostridium perfringens]MDZ5041268.1 hypothetical protein [Clostridium perfringens]BDC03462.1 hypothetical protein CP118TE_31710 [Clostridium perfringens E]